MRLSLRFIIPLILALSLAAYLTVPLVDKLTFKWSSRDLDIRAALISNTLSEQLQASHSLSPQHQSRRLKKLFSRITQDERLAALAYCDGNKMIAASKLFPSKVGCTSEELVESDNELLRAPTGPLYISYEPVGRDGHYLVIVHDMSFVNKRVADTRGYIYLFYLGLVLLVCALTSIIAEWSWWGWMKSLRTLIKAKKPDIREVSPELRPIVREFRTLFRDHTTRDESQISWSPETLREVLKQDLAGEEVVIVSNREPYIHTRRGEKIEIQCPASGLVTALEPVMRACRGTWVAHGSGNADAEVVDKNQRVAVPPDKPTYFLKRVWLTKEEEQGYYNGFANEGLWPLCHIAHTRPIFRSNDWKQYVEVNKKFARAVVEECKTKDPVILVQDYHLALLPRFIKEHLPDATIITFWHIPWPNSESFGICPWTEKILDGMLGSDILGFHTRFHCNNFTDTVDRFLESRIDRDSSTITYQGARTFVRNYPISIEWPLRSLEGQQDVDSCRVSVLKENNIAPHVKIGIGVDRLDYTKGILERFYSIERLLESEPHWQGKISFIQIGAPTRTSISEYQNFEDVVRKEAARINERFGKGDYLPIILRLKHHGPFDVARYFRASDFCFVSSLHDGMNLVAKEFVASRDDEQGVLILSQFAGAARELPEAVIVNPYNIDQCSAAVRLALEMPEDEQKARMRSMRAYIQEFNVYRWAGRMLLDAARMRKRGKFANPLYQQTAGHSENTTHADSPPVQNIAVVL